MILARLCYWSTFKTRFKEQEQMHDEYSVCISGKQLLRWNDDFENYKIPVREQKFYRNDSFYMDDDYFYKLNSDKSSPFYNKATQEVTAPGSTFKIVAATAGVMEGVVGAYDTINCSGKFQLIPPDVNCWIYSERYKSGSHGPLTLSQANTESSNIYFNTG